MSDERLIITETGFLTEFLNQHAQRIERPFCFILGAGVSRPSGIPTGGEMARIWLQEIYEAENFDGVPLVEWATAESLGIEGFALENSSSFYSQLYRRRYGEHEQAGYAFLESKMEGREPSYGYSVLAYLLSETPHKIVITTNFDNLVADALSIHSSRFPLVVGHDSLAQYAAVEPRRPLVAKIHGALGFTPKNRPDEISTLPEGWMNALRRILDRYTPVVIGYEGNDGSLMSFLQSLPNEIPDRIFWCVYSRDIKPSDCSKRVSTTIRDYVRGRRGRFVPIQGFDELMAKILSKLREKGAVPDLYERLKERARQREVAYDEQQRRLFETAMPIEQPDGDKVFIPSHSASDQSLRQAVSEIADSRKDKPWWVWVQEATNASNPDRQQAVLMEALEAYPKNSNVLRYLAIFYEQSRGDYNKADEFYQHAIEADPADPLSLGFYADFLERYLRKIDNAEEYYQRAIEASPKWAYGLSKYAKFLRAHRNQIDKAEEYHQRAIESEPDNQYSLFDYAEFLEEVRQNADRAEELYLRAVEVDPNNSHLLNGYADFLEEVRKDMTKAAELRERIKPVE